MTSNSDQRELPAELRDRIVLHGETTPYHQQLQQKHDIDYGDLHTWGDLRETFELHDDERLRKLDPQELAPSHYGDDELLISRSSGTTGEQKTLYWHETDLDANVEFTAEALETAGVPRDTHWVATVTPNPVLKETLRRLADRYGGTIDLIEVEPGPIKQALSTGEENEIAAALDPIAEQVRAKFHENHTVGVYEDIAPLMEYVSETLSEPLREQVKLLLIGGVGTNEETVRRITRDGFPNASLTGWYGDFMNGTSRMRKPSTLEYVPQYPEIKFDVVSPNTPTRVVDEGDRGAIVAHAIRKGFFIPNRLVGDAARRLTVDGTTAVTDIGRLDRPTE